MLSPQKLQQRLSELLGPPGPEADPIELALRSVVMMTAPAIEGVIAQYTDEQLDQALEHVAVFFLKIRSDGRGFSPEFILALATMSTETAGTAGVPTVTSVPEALPAGPAQPAVPPAPADQPPAAPAPAPADEPPPVPVPPAVPPVPEPPAPSSPAAPAPSGETPPAPPWG